ncbi:MAG: hypothetical protein H0U19_13640 [Acidobacteria bacterium]|nr:hypothetical protein [Acidobacteriota bacterium]
MTKIKDLHSGWRRDGEYRAAYDGLDEFRLARYNDRSVLAFIAELNKRILGARD